MGERYERVIRIVSQIDNEVFEQTVRGIVYKKHSGWYLRYEESDDNGGMTRSIVKLTVTEWSVKRSGSIQSEMYFESGIRRNGFYRTSGIELHIVTIMGQSLVDIQDGLGQASWDYQLHFGSGEAQRHRITYYIT